jgi:hypothetical protein
MQADTASKGGESVGTICEYPCRLDLWAEVVKAKNIQREEVLLDQYVETIEYENVSTIEDARVQVVEASKVFIVSSKIRARLVYNLILTILVENENGTAYHLVTLGPYEYSKDIGVNEFTPPLTTQQCRDEVEDAKVIVKNWIIIPELMEPVVSGTPISLTVLADVIVKLTKFHDIIVYGEYDPEVDP